MSLFAADYIDQGDGTEAMRVFRKGVNVATFMDDGTVIVHVGDVIVEKGDIRIRTGNVRVKQDITLKGSITIEGDLKVSGSTTSRGGYSGPSPTVGVLAPVPPPFVTPDP